MALLVINKGSSFDGQACEESGGDKLHCSNFIDL
jgi:hypothetical protein